MTLLTSVLSSTSPFALTRGLAPLPARVAESLPEWHDVYTPGEHQYPTEEPRPFNLLDNLTRAPYKCIYCEGSGKCQDDYPGPGTGKTWKGEPEYRCSGSGKCQQCGGSGWRSKRYSVIMP
ncbi:MAG: hypothetical protein KF760_04345 [Candidatus Eremiobacteraeota bacterium]|nr:hypothetical protein [Candidatus Eremiobacteraeota bacterium]MCW5867145.1 hypothetical protein [Candidatus Eremiobacteraeota bacterium]